MKEEHSIGIVFDRMFKRFEHVLNLSDHLVQGDIIPKGLIIFQLGGKEFCLDINFLTTILNVREKGSFESVSRDTGNLIKHNDNLYPLVNIMSSSLSKRLDDADCRVMLVDYKGSRFAFSVERISEIIYHDLDDDDQSNPATANSSGDFSTPIKIGGREVSLLDLDKVVTSLL